MTPLTRGSGLLDRANANGTKSIHYKLSGARSRMLTLEQLDVEAATGQIDSVIIGFTDMQGRLQGKRLSTRFFLEEVAEHGSEGCNYLLAVDVEMNTVDGYAMSSWSTGYGDFVLR